MPSHQVDVMLLDWETLTWQSAWLPLIHFTDI